MNSYCLKCNKTVKTSYSSKMELRLTGTMGFDITWMKIYHNVGLSINRWEHGTDMLASKKSRLKYLWFILVGVYKRQSFRSSTSGRFKRNETRHHNSCCKCWRGCVQVCLGRIRLSYWYLSFDKKITHRTFVTSSYKLKNMYYKTM